ncbi:HAMP domain-containing sensor histidine kinase [Vibrio sp. ABG19]|uniref:HAMP domain-containing sensor histidine kinase n=1 Tax=Vibrio sp. ABG19 TaxID=2817385 RepID=UPI00249F1991|nr:HAMP domain-containing sensor histidine kinase [Vibrio sp. ABG19]WGY46415.1 HAMP domain-containing histidine kinase [Vibrio sp. ABG19]
MPVRLIIHSSSFRQAAYVAFFCLIISSASILLSDKLLKNVMLDHVKNMILDDIKNKQNMNLFSSSQKLADYLNQRKLTNQYDELITYTFNPLGDLLYGDAQILTLEEIQTILTRQKAHISTLSFHKPQKELYGMVIPIADGGSYYASYNMSPMLNSTRIIPLMTGAVLFTVLLSILLISLPFSIKNLLRVNRILKVMEEYAKGDHHARITDAGYNDEFGRLSSETNLLLSRTKLLMEQVKTANSHIAHELKTPLTRLKHRLINTSEMVDGSALDELDAASMEIDRILYLFRAIMQLSEIENGQLSLQRESIDAQHLLSEVRDYYEPLLEDKGIELKIKATHKAVFYADYALIFQAVANLLDNAIKYAPQSSMIKLQVEQQLETTYIHVIDEGPGIPDDQLSLVLKRFHRLERVKSIEGFGLGLPFVQAVAERHQGRFTLVNGQTGLIATISCRAMPMS